MSIEVPETPALPLTLEQERVRTAKEAWRQKAAAAFAKTPAWRKDFTTVSSAEVNTLATPDDLGGFDFDRDLGWPGEFPYTRRQALRQPETLGEPDRVCRGASPPC